MYRLYTKFDGYKCTYNRYIHERTHSVRIDTKSTKKRECETERERDWEEEREREWKREIERERWRITRKKSLFSLLNDEQDDVVLLLLVWWPRDTKKYYYFGFFYLSLLWFALIYFHTFLHYTHWCCVTFNCIWCTLFAI